MSTTLPTRMGIAVPSVAEASRRLPPSVKADGPDADDVHVTSVTTAPRAIDEPVSPELALVDPDLAARLRALLPEIEFEPPPRFLRALPDPELESGPALQPPPELVDAAPPFEAAPVPVYVYPSRAERLRSFAKAFALGAAAATVVTVGVVAELGEGPPAEDAGTAPPSVASPAPATSQGGGTGQTAKPATGAAGGAARAKAKTASGTKTQAKRAGRAKAQSSGKKSSAATPATSGRTAGTKKQAAPPAAAAAQPRRFAWAPVGGAVGYRFELFRGDKQVLEVRTTQPAYELASRWRHAGKTETLASGDYRWYVWPVFSDGPAAQAVVQAKLSIP
jgi:hypothetical protein